MIANQKAPYNNMKEMIAYAKEHPEKINVAVAGIGTSGYLAMVQMEDQFGVKFTIVPQGGGAHQKTAVLGGHSDVGPTTANEGGPMVLSKQVKALGVFDEKRYDENPDIPTMIEQGYDVTSYVLMHAYAPAGTPPERVQMLQDAFQKCIQDKSLQKTAKKLNLGLEFKDGATASKDLDKWRVLYGQLIGKLGLKKK
jgi:tripartite-type tricarboxylate transporter receptor subunit TctC